MQTPAATFSALALAVAMVLPARAAVAESARPTRAAPADRATPIVGGTTDMADPAVALVLLQDAAGNGVGLCTGTLISPKVVLTAAHCADADSGAMRHQVYFGYDPFSGSDPTYLGLFDVVDKTVHPSWNPADIGAGFDVALLLLDAVGPTPPRPIRRESISSLAPAALRLVGYGDTSGGADDAGIKRQTMTTLRYVDPGILYYCDTVSGGFCSTTSHNTCQGDSGGPTFMTIGGVEVVVGITSFGDPDCTQYGASTRVDIFAESFIDPWIASRDMINCSADGGCATGCGAPDPDCPCADDGHCTTACANSDDDRNCPAGCNPGGVCVMTGCPRPDPDCDVDPPPIDDCTANGICLTGCPSRDPDCPLTGTGAACAVGNDCVSGICLPALDDATITYCTELCDPAAPACPPPMTCLPTSGTAHVCAYPTPTPGALGAMCVASEDCLSRLCLPGAAGATCSRLCDDARLCPSGFHCAATTDGQGVCIDAGDPGPGDDSPPWYRCAISAAGARGGSVATGLLALASALTLGFAQRRARRARRARR